ncbi:hypothetical protein V8E52_007880 [Russula decolorans]
MNATTQDDGSILLEKFKDIGDKPADVILIFGKTRSGKSTFINDVKARKVVHNHSHTDLAARYINLFYNKDGTKGPQISAFLYFIDIKDAAGLDAGSKLNLPFVDAFVGKGLFPSLCFVTNKWSKDEDEREEQEEREEEWKSELGHHFHGAEITRLHYDHPRASEIKLAKMSERVREGEQAKYRDCALGLVKFALKKPARKRTLLEQEISETAETLLIGQTSLFKAATVSREKVITTIEKEGKGDVAKIMREEMRDISITKARKRAREAGRNAKGKTGEAIGAWYNRAGEALVGAYSVFATSKQASALQKAYHGRMVPRTADWAESGARIAGTPGALAAAAVGGALNCIDGTFTYWRSLFSSNKSRA